MKMHIEEMRLDIKERHPQKGTKKKVQTQTNIFQEATLQKRKLIIIYNISQHNIYSFSLKKEEKKFLFKENHIQCISFP